MAFSLHPKHRADEVWYQPQYTRYHHAFRSPRNSHQLNLQAEQIRFDIKRLYWLLFNLDKFFEAVMRVLHEKTNLNNVAVAAGYTEAVEYGSVYDIDGDGIVNGANPITNSYTYYNSYVNTSYTLDQVLDDTDISLENVANRLEEFSRRLSALEERR